VDAARKMAVDDVFQERFILCKDVSHNGFAFETQDNMLENKTIS
jgi:hypothetical protein